MAAVGTVVQVNTDVAVLVCGCNTMEDSTQTVLLAGKVNRMVSLSATVVLVVASQPLVSLTLMVLKAPIFGAIKTVLD